MDARGRQLDDCGGNIGHVYLHGGFRADVLSDGLALTAGEGRGLVPIANDIGGLASEPSPGFQANLSPVDGERVENLTGLAFHVGGQARMV
jgi:hypothetical protein